MSDILLNLSQAAVLKAIETNMFSFWMAYGHAPGQSAFEDARLQRFATDVPHPLFNAVFGAQLTITQIEPTIAETIDFFRARQSPFFWWIGPLTRPSDLGLRLEAHGLQCGGDTPGMAADLACLPESVPTPADFEIIPVAEQHTLRQWSDVVCIANEFPDSAFDTVYHLEQGRGFGDPPTRYLGLLNGTPVAGAALHLAAGVAGIYAVGTLPEARGQGIGAAITLKPYLDARARGYNVGILQSSSMGYKVYQRLGFRKLCDLTIYYGHGG